MAFDLTSEGSYRRASGDPREGLMELTNLVAHPGAGLGDLPQLPGMKKDDTAEALNLTLHQVRFLTISTILAYSLTSVTNTRGT